MDHGPIWLQLEEESPEKEGQTMQLGNVMTTIFWNPGGLHLIKLRPKGSNSPRVTLSLKSLIHSQFGAELKSEGRI
jgi:hypothetical protein